MKIDRDRYGFEIFVGPWMARLNWGPGHFGWYEGQGPVVRFIRRWWTGWHRWQSKVVCIEPGCERNSFYGELYCGEHG